MSKISNQESSIQDFFKSLTLDPLVDVFCHCYRLSGPGRDPGRGFATARCSCGLAGFLSEAGVGGPSGR